MGPMPIIISKQYRDREERPALSLDEWTFQADLSSYTNWIVSPAGERGVFHPHGSFADKKTGLSVPIPHERTHVAVSQK